MLINILLGITSFLECFLGLGLVTLGRKKKLVNLSFGLVAFAASAWVLSALMTRLISGPALMFWCKNQYAAGALVAAGFLFFTYIFPSGKLNISLLKRIFILCFLAFIVGMIYWPGAFIKQIEIFGFYKEPSFGAISYPVYSLFIIFYFAWAFRNLFAVYLKCKGMVREQLNYVFLGTGFSVVGALIFDIVLPWFNHFYFWLGTLSSLVMVAFVSYAILKKKLFGVRLILTEILITVIASLLLAEIFLSESNSEYIWKTALFLLFVLLGYLLIKSVLKEIKLKEQLVDVNKELRRLDKEKSDFLSIASHQLRTPITVVKGYVSIARDGLLGNFSDKMKEVLDKVYVSNERLIKLINNLLDLSRIERGKMQYDFKEQEFEQLINEVIKELTSTAERKNLLLKYEKPKKDLPKILFDKQYVGQVVVNLIDNAIKYTEQGEIKISLNTTPRGIILRVKDTGKGLTAEEMKNLFKRYKRGLKNGVKGLGLGLYVAKKIVDDHNGKIWAESEGSGKGSSFFVELPHA